MSGYIIEDSSTDDEKKRWREAYHKNRKKILARLKIQRVEKGADSASSYSKNYQKEYYQNNKEKINERSKKYYSDNREKILDRIKKWQDIKWVIIHGNKKELKN